MFRFLYLGSGDEEMEIYDNSEDGDDESDGGIELEDEDDEEESMLPDKAEGSSTGTCILKQL